MRPRIALAALAVAALALFAGCATPFAGQVSDESLDEVPDEPYDWNTTRDVTITVRDDSYQAVYDLNGTTKVEVYERGLSTDRPLTIWAVRYRYPNGTTLTGTQLNVYTAGARRVIEVPNGSGKLAYTSGSGMKEFGQPSFVEGTHEVILPPERRVGSFLFGEVQPRGWESSTDDRGRLHLVWDEPVTSGIYVRYYLPRDVLLFRGLVGLLVLVGIGGAVYYYRKIRKLEEERKDMGLDVDTDDDDLGGGGGPPGFG